MNGPDANGTWLEDEDIAKWKKGFSLLPPIGLIQFLCPSVLATNHMSSATERISQDASRGLRLETMATEFGTKNPADISHPTMTHPMEEPGQGTKERRQALENSEN
ncbi:hypothetical protein IFM46972_03087 [Aspergillus udagawae]|uniref:Uncharacterized protein n=1 Tax=Aspergillus udagawae TaxID=91492 RepID=A0A8H3RSP7_9EURO|nr:hypothetical protein IFM46972_03087 [Aspergillus udagawae]